MPSSATSSFSKSSASRSSRRSATAQTLAVSIRHCVGTAPRLFVVQILAELLKIWPRDVAVPRLTTAQDAHRLAIGEFFFSEPQHSLYTSARHGPGRKTSRWRVSYRTTSKMSASLFSTLFDMGDFRAFPIPMAVGVIQVVARRWRSVVVYRHRSYP